MILGNQLVAGLKIVPQRLADYLELQRLNKLASNFLDAFWSLYLDH